jgi:glucosamine--fructose-6-phosphate aminotransferase (isomerizing)
VTTPLPSLDHLLTWREASTSGDAIASALAAGRDAAGDLARLFAGSERIVLTGAGSSYYIAQAAAAVARETTGNVVLAAPLSELILRPSGVVGQGPAGRQPIVVVSRSGSTSEAVEVAARMRDAGHPTVGLTCRADSPLAVGSDHVLVSPDGDESAIVMTRSFASMLALLLRATVGAGGNEPAAGADSLAADLDRLPAHWSEAVAAAEVGRRLGTVDRRRVVILGGGPAHGIAQEWGLKLTETSQVPTDVYEPLEFRHGPISVCEPGVLVVGLIGGPGAGEEVRVLGEAAALGADTWAIGREATDVDGPAGASSIVGAGLHPWARLPLLVYPAQALALTLALTRGCDPDAPRHLGQVVIVGPA